MNRRMFISAAAVTAAATLVSAQDKACAAKGEHGACGLSCNTCRMKLNGKCPGCGVGAKAECPILKCVQMKKLNCCAECKGYPCPKIKESGKFGEKWMEKISKAPIEKS
jgi:hypothetical protein